MVPAIELNYGADRLEMRQSPRPEGQGLQTPGVLRGLAGIPEQRTRNHSIESYFADVGDQARPVKRDEVDVENLCRVGKFSTGPVGVRHLDDLAHESFSF